MVRRPTVLAAVQEMHSVLVAVEGEELMMKQLVWVAARAMLSPLPVSQEVLADYPSATPRYPSCTAAPFPLAPDPRAPSDRIFRSGQRIRTSCNAAGVIGVEVRFSFSSCNGVA